MHPRLLHIYGPLWIQSYGVMIAIGFIVLVFCTYNHPLRKRLMSDIIYHNTLFIGLASGIIGGRLLHAFAEPETLQGHWIDILFPWVPGFYALGAIIGAIIGIVTYVWWRKVPVLPVLDLAALYVPLMQSIARIGCFAAGCCYGTPAYGLSWAITFTNPDAVAPLNVPLHPTQLYMSIGSLIIFILLRLAWPRLKSRAGSIVMLALMLENISRFVMDFWRADRHLAPLTFGNSTVTLSHAQWLAIPVFLVAMVGFVVIWRSNK